MRQDQVVPAPPEQCSSTGTSEENMKKALIDSAGRLVQVSEPEDIFDVAEGMFWADCPDECEAYVWTYAEGEFIAPIAQTVEDLKLLKRAQIERDRDFARYANVIAHERSWQADRVSQDLLNGAINLASNGLPLPTIWRDASNADMVITTLADLLVIAGAMALQTQAAYATSWARKAALELAETAEQVEAV
jgi:hypothetical protein